MKITVTGGAGFIGSNLVKHLVEKGHEVIVIDNLLTGSVKNLDLLIAQKKIKFFELDLNRDKELKHITKKQDALIHLAALGSVPRSMALPTDTSKNNIDAFQRVLEALRHNNIPKLIYASSSSVYGASEAKTKYEPEIGNPLSPYAYSKRMNEIQAEEWSKLYPMQHVGLRFFNIFGPNQNPNGAYSAVIPRWIDAMMKNEDVWINGSGLISRDFTHVDNAIHMIDLCLEQKINKSDSHILNVCCGKTHTLFDLYWELKHHLNSKSEYRIAEPRKGDIKNSLGSTLMAKMQRGYNPKVDFKSGIYKLCMEMLSRKGAK